MASTVGNGTNGTHVLPRQGVVTDAAADAQGATETGDANLTNVSPDVFDGNSTATRTPPPTTVDPNAGPRGDGSPQAEADEPNFFSKAMGWVGKANDSPVVNGALSFAAIHQVGSAAGLALSLVQLVDEISSGKPISWGNVGAGIFFAVGMFLPGVGAIGGLLKLMQSMDKKGRGGGSSADPPPATNTSTGTDGPALDPQAEALRRQGTERVDDTAEPRTLTEPEEESPVTEPRTGPREEEAAGAE